jgi:hypothetical protein
MDLLTVLMHEIGHILNYDHSDGNGLMDTTLDVSERIVPVFEERDNGNGNGAKGKQTLVFDESRGEFVDPVAHGAVARTDDHTLTFDPSEWSEVAVNTDDEDDWIVDLS